MATLLWLCLALSPAACSAPDGATPSPDRVRAVVLPYLTHAPLHIAAEEGYFDKRGLDVEFVKLGRNQDIMTALAHGDVDVASGMLTVNELNLIARGARVRLVAALGDLAPDHCPAAAFVVRREHLQSGALESRDRIRELRFDADILIPLGYWIDELLEPFDLTIDDLDLVNLPSPAAVDALARGAIDVTVDSEPWIGIHTAAEHAVIWEPIGELLPGYVLNTTMYGPALLDERPEVGERFATALLEAVRQYNLGKTERNLAIVERGTGLSPEQVSAACWARMSDDARVDPSVFRGYQEWAVARGLVDRVIPDDELVERRFMDHANEALADPGGRAEATPDG